MLTVERINSYYGDAHVLQDVSLRIERGTVVTLLGRNGAGKSTTLKTIMGIVPARSGQISFLDQEITTLPCEEVARLGIAFVPEDRRIIPNLTVAENLRLGMLGGEAPGRTAGSLAEVFQYFPALEAMVNRRGGLLSGGEQQMLAIARALIAHPALILVDEPTEGLSPLLVQTLVESLRQINAQGTTILLVEQSLDVAFALSDYVYVIDQGHIRFEGQPGALKANVDLQQELLGV